MASPGFYGAALTSGATVNATIPNRWWRSISGPDQPDQAGRAAGLRRLINISSGAVYGAGDHPAYGAEIDEGTAPADPNSIYGTTKFASERITRRLAELSALDLFSVRLRRSMGLGSGQRRPRHLEPPDAGGLIGAPGRNRHSAAARGPRVDL